MLEMPVLTKFLQGDDNAAGDALSKQYTYNSFNYEFVRNDSNLQSIVDTVVKGVAGPLKTANVGKVRKIMHAWHTNGDALHFNIKLPKADGTFDPVYSMYHVYEDGTSKNIPTRGNPPQPQNAVPAWQRTWNIVNRPA